MMPDSLDGKSDEKILQQPLVTEQVQRVPDGNEYPPRTDSTYETDVNLKPTPQIVIPDGGRQAWLTVLGG